MQLLLLADCTTTRMPFPSVCLIQLTVLASSSSPQKLMPPTLVISGHENHSPTTSQERARSPWSSVQREGERGEWERGTEGSLVWEGVGAMCCSRNFGAGKAAINQARNDQSLRWACNLEEKCRFGKREENVWVELEEMSPEWSIALPPVSRPSGSRCETRVRNERMKNQSPDSAVYMMDESDR